LTDEQLAAFGRFAAGPLDQAVLEWFFFLDHANRYVLTPDGIKVAVFYTKLHNRLLRPLLAAGQPQAPPELRAALRAIDQHVDHYISRARLGQAA
jgi:hypothetical protein